MKRFRAMSLAFALTAAIVPAFPYKSLADCGYDGVAIAGTATEIADTCRALSEVLDYFAQIGFKIQPNFKIMFSERVFIDIYDAQTQKITSKVQVSAFYDAGRNTIEATSASSPFQKERKPWGVEWGREISYSIVQHELIHGVVHQILSNSYSRTAKAWLEYVAYSVQFEIMSPDLRNRIAFNNPNIGPFDRPDQVNDMIHAFDPDLFGLRAHLFTQANGGRDFIRRILTSEVEFVTAPFLWTK